MGELNKQARLTDRSKKAESESKMQKLWKVGITIFSLSVEQLAAGDLTAESSKGKL